MTSKKETKRFVAFLRGINVGGHHKVPMADLKQLMSTLKFDNVVTILNSGNIIFDAETDNTENLQTTISGNLEKTFGFPVPTIVRSAETILELYQKAPFQDVEVTKDIRLYVSFLRQDKKPDHEVPWTSPDGSFNIIESNDRIILSILDLSVSKTPKAMEALEKFYEKKNITTRNWKTIERIV
ncbi:MAG: DUF1697 domain-containing protein, partial [Bacteroidetes bacterium]